MKGELNNMETRFLYSVFPKMLIRNLPGVSAFRTQKSLSLTKDEVKYCLKFGTVYRRFVNESKNERVTLENIDRLHNDRYMTEVEYEAFKKENIDSNRGQGYIPLDSLSTDRATVSPEDQEAVNVENTKPETTVDNKTPEVNNNDEKTKTVQQAATASYSKKKKH